MPHRRIALGRTTCRLLTGVVPVAVLGWALHLASEPLRYGTVAAVLVAVAAALPFGPAADHWAARLLRLCGYSAVAVEGVALTHSLGSAGDQSLPLFGAVLVCCTVAPAAATSRRAALDARALAVGGAVAAVTGAAFLVPVLLSPPLPVSSGWALLAPVAAGAAALLIARNRFPGPRPAAIAVLCAVALTAVLLAATVECVLEFSAHWVPDTSPVNVAAADRLANNRLGAEDPYLRVLGLGFLASLALAGLTVRGGRARDGALSSRGTPATGSAAASAAR